MKMVGHVQRRSPLEKEPVEGGMLSLSTWRKTGRVFLGVVVAVLPLLFFVSCTQRMSLELYLQHLDEIRARSDTASAIIEQELDSIPNGPGAFAALDRRISSAGEVLEECRKEIDRLEAPAIASKLDAIVLELHSEAIGFLTDLESMLRYTAKREPIVAGVEAASKQLDSSIASDPSSSSAASALDSARAGVDGAAAELKKVKPPSFLVGVHDALLAMLQSYASSLSALREAVASGNVGAIDSAQSELKKSLSGNLVEQTKSAIKTYNSRIERIERLRREANEEETRITSSPG